MFRAAKLMLMNKCDPAAICKLQRLPRCQSNCTARESGIEVIEVSATTGAGMDAWLEWIARGAAEIENPPGAPCS